MWAVQKMLLQLFQNHLGLKCDLISKITQSISSRTHKEEENDSGEVGKSLNGFSMILLLISYFFTTLSPWAQQNEEIFLDSSHCWRFSIFGIIICLIDYRNFELKLPNILIFNNCLNCIYPPDITPGF